MCIVAGQFAYFSSGNAEDYFRVASNVSTMLELVLAEAKGWPVSQVFSFASVTMPIVAVVLTAPGPVSPTHPHCSPEFILHVLL
jgi:hypothetical protein